MKNSSLKKTCQPTDDPQVTDRPPTGRRQATTGRGQATDRLPTGYQLATYRELRSKTKLRLNGKYPLNVELK